MINRETAMFKFFFRNADFLKDFVKAFLKNFTIIRNYEDSYFVNLDYKRIEFYHKLHKTKQ